MRKFMVAFAVMSLVLVGCSCGKCGVNPGKFVKAPFDVMGKVPAKFAKLGTCNKCSVKQPKAPRCSTCKAGKITKVKQPCHARCDDCQMQALSFCSDCAANDTFVSPAELSATMPLGTKKVVVVEREVVPAPAAAPAAPAAAPAKK